MAEMNESAVLKFARDAAIAIVGGIVLEPTLKQIHFDVGPYLRHIWLGVLLFLTLDYLTRNYLGRLIEWKKSLTRGKKFMSYLLVGLVCAAVGCVYWAALGTLIQAKEPKKITKTERFATLVPIIPAAPNNPIPMDTNHLDPHGEFYQELLGLSGRPENPPANWPPYADRKLKVDNGIGFAMDLIHYYTFYSIYRLQRGSSGIRWTADVGVTPIQRNPTPPPDSTPYPNDALLKMLASSEFLRPGDKLMWSYDTNRLVVPKKTSLSLTEIPSIPEKGQMRVIGIRFERPGYYVLTFEVSPSFAAGTMMPPHFEPKEIPGALTWSVLVTMHYEITRREDDDFEPEAYAAWADALFDGLKSKMEVN